MGWLLISVYLENLTAKSQKKIFAKLAYLNETAIWASSIINKAI